MGTVPEGARGPALDLSRGLAVEEIGDGLFLVADGDRQALFADTGDGVVAFDAPWGREHLGAIRQVTSDPVTHIVYSHSHYDHIGGAGALDASVIIAHSATDEILRRHADPRRPVPTRTFDDHLTVQVGRHTFELRYHGPNHQDGNIVVHVPGQRTLMVVDVIVPGWVPFHALGGATDVAGYLDLHHTLLDYDFEVLIGGHLTRPGTRDDVRIQSEFLDDVRTSCIAARTTVSASQVAAETGLDDKWQFASAYFNRLAATAAADVTPRWTDRLGGAEAFTHSHCLAMIIALAHEWGVEPAD